MLKEFLNHCLNGSLNLNDVSGEELVEMFQLAAILLTANDFSCLSCSLILREHLREHFRTKVRGNESPLLQWEVVTSGV